MSQKLRRRNYTTKIIDYKRFNRFFIQRVRPAFGQVADDVGAGGLGDDVGDEVGGE